LSSCWPRVWPNLSISGAISKSASPRPEAQSGGRRDRLTARPHLLTIKPASDAPDRSPTGTGARQNARSRKGILSSSAMASQQPSTARSSPAPLVSQHRAGACAPFAPPSPSRTRRGCRKPPPQPFVDDFMRFLQGAVGGARLRRHEAAPPPGQSVRQGEPRQTMPHPRNQDARSRAVGSPPCPMLRPAPPEFDG
jgi:hypothetical protein